MVSSSTSSRWITRRSFLAASAVISGNAVLAGCSANTGGSQGLGAVKPLSTELPAVNYNQAYAATFDTEVDLPAFDHTKMDEKYLRQWVKFRSRQKPGTVIVDTSGPHLYLVQPNNRAIRYGIAVGREGFAWHGDAVMKWKQKWPTWTPPAEMIARTPELREFADGMPAGVNNPLGARALYLFKDGRDTLFRIHGTNRPFSIGKAASSGCFRMVNQDVIDLYERVPPGSAVYVKPNLDTERGI
ncbi:MAG: L,D-transpeptidase [Pseudomonadota bacterium]